MVANNMKELEQMLLSEMQKAMNEASKDMLKDMKEETEDYYTGTKPKEYVRTYALKNTPRISNCVTTGNTITFEAYLEQSHQYTTGDKPSMTQVLNLANYGTTWADYVKPTLGKRNFWERSEVKMKNSLDKVMGKFFK